MLKQTFSLLLAVVSLFAVTSVSQAVPAGPGGIGDASGTSSLKLWLKPDAGVQADDGFGGYVPAGNTDQVRRWLDSSGSSNHAVQNTLVNRPTYNTVGLNGQPTLNFDATTTVQFLTTPQYMNFSDPQIYVVGRKVSGTGVAYSVGGHNVNPRIQLRYHNNPNQFWMGMNDNAGQSFQTLPGRPTTVLNMASYQLIDDTMQMRYNGEPVFTETNNDWTNPTFDSGNVPTIGKDSQIGSYNLNGNVSEIIVFDSPLTTIQRTMVDNAMSAKYDLTLFNNDKYDGDQGAQGDYDADVFGIGNDGVSTLLTNASAGLQISATSLDTGEYALAGNKTPVNSLISNDPEFQWERDFFVDVTGSFDATLTFDFDEAGFAANELFTKLLYSDTEGGPFTVLDATAVFSGNQISFNLSAAQFLDGYYTIGGQIPEPSSFALLGLGFAFIARRRRRKSA